MKYIVMISGAVGFLVLGAMGFVLIATTAVTGQVSASVTDAVTGSAPDGPVAGIPPAYLADTVASGARFGVPWSVLAGIYRVECDFGRSRLAGCNPPGTENRAGAQGPGQFLAPTWRRGLGAMAIIPPGPPTTSTADGFATDGDGDGIADPWDPADAVASTARMLAADGGHRDIGAAVFAYDHSRAYVDEVLSLAAGYRRAAATTATSAAARVVAFARSQLGAPYLWGGAGPGGWDCSGLVMVAYERVGIDLPHNALAQYDATRAATVPLGALDPGDLVFFGPDLGGIEHVGIYVGGGDMIDAPHTGAFVRREPIGWDDLLTATRPLAAAGAGAREAAPAPTESEAAARQ